MGINFHDYPKIKHLYKSNTQDKTQLYGNGFTYSELLDDDLHDDDTDHKIIKNIISKKYDLIIYGSYHRGMPFYDIITTIYDSEKIVLLCGEDEHVCDYKKWCDKKHFVFVRELYP
jgi:hypothetical protein